MTPGLARRPPPQGSAAVLAGATACWRTARDPVRDVSRRVWRSGVITVLCWASLFAFATLAANLGTGRG